MKRRPAAWLEREVGGRLGGDPDEADALPCALDDRVRGQDGRPRRSTVLAPRCGKPAPAKRIGGVTSLPAASGLAASRPLPAAAQEAQGHGDALVELVVSQRADVEAAPGSWPSPSARRGSGSRRAARHRPSRRRHTRIVRPGWTARRGGGARRPDRPAPPHGLASGCSGGGGSRSPWRSLTPRIWRVTRPEAGGRSAPAAAGAGGSLGAIAGGQGDGPAGAPPASRRGRRTRVEEGRRRSRGLLTFARCRRRSIRTQASGSDAWRPLAVN